MRRAEHVDAVRDQMLFGGDELVIAADLEGEMLDPLRPLLLAAPVGLVRPLDKAEDIAVPRLAVDVTIGIILPARRTLITAKTGGRSHYADHPLTTPPHHTPA